MDELLEEIINSLDSEEHPRWLGAFERYGWTFTPLHPSVLSEDGLRSVLGGGSGSRYHSPPSSSSPLSSSSSSSSSSPSSSSFSLGSACLTGPAVFELNINTALAYGALIMGNDVRAEEFFERARKALEDLLEVNDYAVAEALFALGYYLYGRGDLVRFSYYITLAKQICQRIGYRHPVLPIHIFGVFLKCMMATVLDPSYTPAEKERTLRRYNRAVKDTPRWDDHHDRFLLDHNRPSHQGDNQYVAEEVTVAGAITLGTIGGSSGEVTPHDVLDTVERARNIDKCVTNVLMLVGLHRWLRQEAEAGRGLGDEATDTVLQQWRRLIVAMEEEIGSGEALPPTFKLTVTLTWLCFSAEYYQRAGNTEVRTEAQRFALAYLEQIQGGGIELCTSGCIALCEIMMDLCFELGRPLIERHPLCRDRAAAYRELLKARASSAVNSATSQAVYI
ncbi:uncharacterized protein ACA1_153590 [Acanthamoeba castellanii str. Neff]|uniref:Uncharacterized protein n=1 Tax=Acanthamoeba castellanii (strain ATCC 30010 / Neff) TaxID=1257118 RepID=L8HF62_ACACF|nr:uncharacterized protein ACA1_153590 [Acanthamoeba castellanii str. Neff]ELR24129.1 hypothetical protein ACA1_153590 [Acanthamoeba castellanii str. Neff]